MRRFLFLATKKCRIYAAFGVSQTPKSIEKNVRSKENYGLTARELDVAKLAALRYSNKEIADKLIIAESTVKSNMKIIFSKLNITSRQELSKFF